MRKFIAVLALVSTSTLAQEAPPKDTGPVITFPVGQVIHFSVGEGTGAALTPDQQAAVDKAIQDYFKTIPICSTGTTMPQ